MALYQNNLDTLKEIPILDVWNRYVGADLRKQGARYSARCPFHAGGNERIPSLSLDTNRNSFKCFSCGVGGSGIDLVMVALGLDFREACRTLAADFGIEWGGRPPTREERQKAREEAQKRELVKAFRAWCEKTYIHLCVLIRCTDKVIYRDTEQVEELTGILNMEPIWWYWLDILQSGTDEEKFLLFTDEAVKMWTLT